MREEFAGLKKYQVSEKDGIVQNVKIEREMVFHNVIKLEFWRPHFCDG